MQLLEREPYFDMLTSSLSGCAAGIGHVVLVSGEAGIGKTSLLREFAARHAKSSRILWGGCEALFTPHPLAPLHDIARQVGPDFVTAISAAANRHVVFNLTLDRFAQLPPGTVVVVEDAHWADEATLDLIKFLGRRLQRLAMLLVISYRDDEVNDKHPLRSVLGDLPHKSVTRIRLPPLSEGAVGSLAEAAGRSSAGLHELTGGNAFFVTEVLATSSSDIPATVRDAAMARIARLPEAARRISHLVAIVPGKAERWLMDGTVKPGRDALQECLAVGMVVQPDYSLSFRHELARRAVEDNIAPAERQELHASVLAALLAHGAEKVAVGRLVHHADQAGDDAAVLRFAPSAAEDAATVGAHRDAAAYLKVALRHGGSLTGEQRAQLLDRYSYECYLTDQISEAIEARKAALELWRKLGDRLKQGDDLRWLSRITWYAGQKQVAEEHARQAVALLEALPPGRELAMAYSNFAQLYMLSSEMQKSLEWGRKALLLATGLGETEIQIHALGNVGAVKLLADGTSGHEELERSMLMAKAEGFEEHASRAYTNLGTAYLRTRNMPAAMQYLNAGIAYCEERDLDSWTRYMKAQRSGALLGLGRWDEAADDAGSVLRHANAAAIIRIPALVTLGRLRARRGDPDMETPLDEAYRLAVPTGELQRLGPVMAARAEAAWMHGVTTEKLLGDLAHTYEMSLSLADPWAQGELGFWLWRNGRLERDPPASAGAPYLKQMRGDWRGAAGAWQALGWPYEQAMALADSDEEASLREALAIFERLGANPMAAQVKRKLRAIGVRSIPRGAQERTRHNPAGMTNQELKVLMLVMEGLRNAEIARRLFLSEKTVGHHVSAVLSKLGVKSRGEAAAAAVKLGVGGGPLEPEE
ncbi:MAG TPA: AAA family ATPase [Gammaproteobacteria bacterium]|jgi:DNA-binding CsgD family transcriptional regulator/tetratricopeptide (TPR) repeat protein|nr:AAA family ATPase [Gammaproteobacteria bacterium]